MNCPKCGYRMEATITIDADCYEGDHELNVEFWCHNPAITQYSGLFGCLNPIRPEGLQDKAGAEKWLTEHYQDEAQDEGQGGAQAKRTKRTERAD